MTDLPADSITPSLPPLNHVGVDYFGPISVKVLRSLEAEVASLRVWQQELYILEVAHSLESDDFINVLERLVCRNGHPKLIRSNCGKKFQGSTEPKKEIETMDQMKIDESLRKKTNQVGIQPTRITAHGWRMGEDGKKCENFVTRHSTWRYDSPERFQLNDYTDRSRGPHQH